MNLTVKCYYESKGINYFKHTHTSDSKIMKPVFYI